MPRRAPHYLRCSSIARIDSDRAPSCRRSDRVRRDGHVQRMLLWPPHFLHTGPVPTNRGHHHADPRQWIHADHRRAAVTTGRPLRRISGEPSLPLPTDSWPGSIPAVRQVVDEGLDLGALTVIVGENGAGKSTLVEAFAMAFGMSPEGGSTGARHSTRPSESTLHQHFRLIRGTAGARWGFFLRAETMHGFYSYLEDNCAKGYEPKFHEMSHGESFLQVLASRFDSPGLYVLDEPEAALSFQSTLALVDVLLEIVRGDTAQAVVATHSPIVAATPGADLYEVGDWGIRPSTWDELALVRHWRAFMDEPETYLRHLRP